MGPELLHPQLFGYEDSFPTIKSDCYALGMVILEVLGGQAPFARDNVVTVMRKVLDGERPERPEEVWFADDLWETLEQCWSHHPPARPTVEVILRCLDRASLAITTDSLQRLVSRSFSQGELPSLLETVFWDREPTDIVQFLQGGDTQPLVDILYEVHYHARSKFSKNMSIYFHLNLLHFYLGIELARSPIGLPEQVHGLTTPDLRSSCPVSPFAEDRAL